MKNYYEIQNEVRITKSYETNLLIVENELIVPKSFVSYSDGLTQDDICLIRINNKNSF